MTRRGAAILAARGWGLATRGWGTASDRSIGPRPYAAHS